MKIEAVARLIQDDMELIVTIEAIAHERVLKTMPCQLYGVFQEDSKHDIPYTNISLRTEFFDTEIEYDLVDTMKPLELHLILVSEKATSLYQGHCIITNEPRQDILAHIKMYNHFELRVIGELINLGQTI